MTKLREEMENVHEDFNVEKAKREILADEKDRLQKFVENLRRSLGSCFCIATQSYQRLKSIFSSIGARSSRVHYAYDNVAWAVKWVDREVDVFDGILSTQRD
jgi:hypothetical protein